MIRTKQLHSSSSSLTMGAGRISLGQRPTLAVRLFRQALRAGLTRARRFLLLPAALLLGALSLLAAAPAAAQDTGPPDDIYYVTGDRAIQLHWQRRSPQHVVLIRWHEITSPNPGWQNPFHCNVADRGLKTPSGSTSYTISNLKNGASYNVQLGTGTGGSGSTINCDLEPDNTDRGYDIRGGGFARFTIGVPDPPASTNNKLSALTVHSSTDNSDFSTQATFSTAFSPSLSAFSATVPHGSTHVKVTPTVADTGKATVKVAKLGESLLSVTSGTASDAIALATVGETRIKIEVTAENGARTNNIIRLTREAASSNNPPSFAATSLTRSVAENTAANTNVGDAIPAATDEDSGDTLTYTMEGTDASSFTFDASSRQIKTKQGVTYDHEAKSSYSVTVKVSDGPASDTVPVTINITDVDEPPSKPAAPTVSWASTTSLSVSWSAPANTGKPAITSYDLRYRIGTSGNWSNGPQDQTGTSATISSLSAGASYQVQVRATNAEGDSDWSDAGTVALAVPTGLTVEAFADKIAVSWTAVTGAVSYGFLIEKVSGGTIWAFGIEAPHTATAAIKDSYFTLETGTAYRVRVRACPTVNFRISATDCSGYSGNVNATTPSSLPATPANFVATAGNDRIDVIWAASAGATAGYEIGIGKVSEGTFPASWSVTSPTATSSFLPEQGGFAANGVEYQLRIRACKAAVPATNTGKGCGAWSATQTVTPQAASSADARLNGLTAHSSTDGSDFSTALSIGTFVPATESYTASVENSVTHVKLTPRTAHSGATVKVGKGTNLTATDIGTASAAIALSVGANAIKVEVTAQDGTTVKTYTVTVTRAAAASANANLSALAAASATSAGGTYTALSFGTFAKATLSYTASVPNATTHVKLTPTVEDTGKATLKVGKSGSLSSVNSGTASAAIALDVGANVLKVEVTAEDGTTKQTYTVTVTRAAAAGSFGGLTGVNAVVGDGKITVSWNAGTHTGGVLLRWSGQVGLWQSRYNGCDRIEGYLVPASSEEYEITGTWRNPDPFSIQRHTEIKTSLVSGREYNVQLALTASSVAGGDNSPGCTALATAGADVGGKYKRWRLMLPSSDATLSALTAAGSTDGSAFDQSVSIGSFAASTLSYTATVPYATTHVKLTPTVNESNATVKVGKSGSLSSVNSGEASAAIALDVGDNAIEVEVTAEDGTTVKTYTVTVTRAGLILSADVAPSEAAAGQAGQVVTVTVALMEPAQADMTVTLTVDGSSTATARSDYVWLLGPLTIARGATAAATRLTVLDDYVAEADETILIDASSATPALTAQRLTLTIADNDTAGTSMVEPRATGTGVLLDATELTLSTPQAANSYPVRLTSQPAGDVTITPASNAPGTAIVRPASHTFTPSDWNHAKRFTVVGVAAGTATISHEAVSSDSGYGGLTVPSVSVTVQESYFDPDPPRDQRVDKPNGQEGGQTVVRRPLRASFEQVPGEHDGTGFAFLVRFSEALGTAARPPAANSFEVAQGRVKNVEQVEAGLWRVRVAPRNWKRDVTVTLAGGRGCEAAGAVCTAAGGVLANTASAAVPGPVRIKVKGGKAREGKDAAIAFAVTLSRGSAAPVSVDWATADGTATAGEDYTATSGTLIFAPGVTSRAVSVAVLDDVVDEGKERFTLTLSNPAGARILDGKATGVIVNVDPLQRMWLSRFGRTVGSQVTGAVSERLAGLAPGAHATLGGQALDLEAGDARALADAVTGLARAFGASDAPVSNDDDPFARHGLGRGWDAPAATTAARSMTGRELLLGSAFHLSSQGEGSGPGLAAWGRVSAGGFDGEAPADTGRLRIDGGEVLTGVLGADAEWDRLLAGVAVSLSKGDGTFDNPGVDKGGVESTMTAVSPYARMKVTERVSAWGLAGWGTGAMTITQDARTATATRSARERKVTKTDLSMRLGALGARGALLDPGEAGGMDLALKADAFFVRTEWERVSGETDTAADASRLRLVLEGGRAFEVGEGATVRPSLELGLRHDGGDAETGTGVELGGGVSYADAASGLSIKAKARMLAAHADSDYEEWGVSASVRLDPGAHGRGLSFSLSPTLGASSSAAERLWGAQRARDLAPGGGEFEAARSLQGEMGYGVPLFGERFTGTPNAGFGLSGGGARDWRIGWRLTSAVPNDPGFEVSLDATRREPADGNAPPEHGVMLKSLIRW